MSENNGGSDRKYTDEQLKQARQCRDCPVCSRARNKQKGVAYWFVKNIEGGMCPACASYEVVYGRKAYAPVPVRASDE